MALLIFKFGLPALLGFTLFVGIAGRLNPFSKPHYPEETPSWLLGIWTGLCVAFVLSAGLHMAYGMTLEGARSLAMPTAWLISALLIPGIMMYLWHKQKVRQELSQPVKPNFDWSTQVDNLEFLAEIDSSLENLNPADPFDLNALSLDTIDVPGESGPVIATFLESPDLRIVDTQSLPEPVNDTYEPPVETLMEVRSTTDADITDTESPDFTSTDIGETADMDMTQFLNLQAIELAADDAQHDGIELEALQVAFDDENKAKAETEKHLRITRKALAKIESETRNYESHKADSISALEEQLAQSITLQSDSECKAATEESRRMGLESNVAQLKKDIVKAKHAVRHSLAARAKALSTANKCIALARQTVQVRTRLESELAEVKITNDNRQATISSLISKLEEEKSRTDGDIFTMAMQYVAREKYLQAKKSSELANRSVDNKLKTRLVKKVAKARPVLKAVAGSK